MKKFNFRRLLTTSLAACTVLGSLVFAPIGVAAEEPIQAPETQSSHWENIVITIFWPPSPSYVNDEQFKLMADAGITDVFGAGNGCDSMETQAKMIELAGKYGNSFIRMPNDMRDS